MRVETLLGTWASRRSVLMPRLRLDERPGEVGRDAHLMGSCARTLKALERQYRADEASRRVEAERRRRNGRLVGIDWGSATHQMCVMVVTHYSSNPCRAWGS